MQFALHPPETSPLVFVSDIGYAQHRRNGITLHNELFLLPRLFLHFLDLYHFRLAKYIFKYPELIVFNELRLATRLALLFSEEVLVPASAYFENRRARRILREHLPFCEAGHLYLCAGDATLAEHFEKKKTRRYDEHSTAELQSAYRRMPSIPILYRSAAINTTKVMNDHWSAILESGELVSIISSGAFLKIPPNFESLWQRIPEVLEDRAFVSSHVSQSFEQLGTTAPPEFSLLRVLDPAFTLSYVEPLGAGLVNDLLYTQPPWSIPHRNRGFSFAQSKSQLIRENLLSFIDLSDSGSLLQLKLLPEWKVVASYLRADVFEKTSEIEKGLNEIKRSLFSLGVKRQRKPLERVVGIITALPEEWLAVVTALEAKESKPIENDPNRYALAAIKTDDTPSHLTVVITFMPRVGTNSAATVTTNLLRSFPAVTDLIFCGIACGCPNEAKAEKHVRLGDIVVSDFKGIIQLDHQANKSGVIENRSEMPIPSRALLNSVRLLQSDEIEGHHGWKTILDEMIRRNKAFRRPPANTDVLCDEIGNHIAHPKDRSRRRGRPKVFCGAIGSSNTLFRNRTLRTELSNKYDLRAIEMEGAGTAEAVWQFGKNYLVVRGICDYGDDLLKNDTWHYYAAAVAAAYTRSILDRMVIRK